MKHLKCSALATLVLILAFPAKGFPCGYCSGDRAASVYSFKNKRFAQRVGGSYSVITFSGPLDEEQFEQALRELRNLKGVFPKTVHGSYAQKAASFVHDSGVPLGDLTRTVDAAHPDWKIEVVETGARSP